MKREKPMSKHTPGPWRARSCQTAVLVDVVRNGDAMLIALVADNDSRGDTDTERKMNNASLIAAAPQVLEALELADELIDQLIIDNTDNYAEERVKIRAAIAAAKGATERGGGL